MDERHEKTHCLSTEMGDTDDFFAVMERDRIGLSFGDVRLRSQFSNVLPGHVSFSTRFSRNVSLRIPVASAAMDTVTEHEMAIAMAMAGGIGIIHRNMTPEAQANEVDRVKFFTNARIEKPICIRNTSQTIDEVRRWREEKGYRFTSFPVLDSAGRLIGLITGDHFGYSDGAQTVGQVMKGVRELVTATEGITVPDAYELLRHNQKKILPLVNEKRELVGIYVYSDLKRIAAGGLYNTDGNGNLRVGAAIGVGEGALSRAALLVEKKVDVLVIDTAHANTVSVFETLRALKFRFQDTDVVVGNISEEEAARTLIDAGADGLKVGQGAGSICITGTVTGVGRAQLSAIYWSARAARGSGVPVCADGGIRSSGDITLALAAGAHTVMLGNLLAGTEEVPGMVVIVGNTRMKIYRGMGSASAIVGNADRYVQGGKFDGKVVIAEGVEAAVPVKGTVASVLAEYLGGLERGMTAVGADSLATLQKNARFERLTQAAAVELRPHDVTVIQEVVPRAPFASK